MFESAQHDELKTIWNSKAFSAELLFPPSEFPLNLMTTLARWRCPHIRQLFTVF